MEFLNSLGAYFERLGDIGLCLNSFIESFFLIPPPDFLLIAMDLNKRELALYYALLCTISSALGGAVGYGIGKWFGRPAFDWIFSGLQKRGNNKAKEYFDKVEKLYAEYGAWAVFFAGFTPLPYKVFTIASGILKMEFLPFIIASFVGRGMRFFIVSIVLMIFGEHIKAHLGLVCGITSLVIVIFFIILYKKRKSIIK